MTTGRRILVVVAVMVATLIGLFVAAGVFIEITRPPSELTVRNSSGVEVKDVVVEGVGFQERFARLSPRETVVRRFEPGADSGVGVSFSIEGRRVDVPAQDYVTGGGYSCLVDISSESSASVHCGPAV